MNLENSPYFDQLIENIEEGRLTSSGKCYEEEVNLAVHQIRTQDKKFATPPENSPQSIRRRRKCSKKLRRTTE